MPKDYLLICCCLKCAYIFYFNQCAHHFRTTDVMISYIYLWCFLKINVSTLIATSDHFKLHFILSSLHTNVYLNVKDIHVKRFPFH